MNIKDYSEILVVDLECTCCDDSSFPRKEMEIIEIGIAVFETTDFNMLSVFKSVIKPEIHPTLTKFCTNLTHISQTEVDDGCDLDFIMKNIESWIDLPSDNRVCWGSWGDFDRKQIELECSKKSIVNPFRLIKHINLKNEFANKSGIKRGCGLRKALSSQKLTFEGTPHRALPDAKNTGRLLPFIFKETA